LRCIKAGLRAQGQALKGFCAQHEQEFICPVEHRGLLLA
jgi:hypothetical protein